MKQKFGYGKGVKAVAFLLACLSFMATAIFAVRAGGAFAFRDDPFASTGADVDEELAAFHSFANSYPFSDRLRDDLTKINSFVKKYPSSESVQNGTALLEAVERQEKERSEKITNHLELAEQEAQRRREAANEEITNEEASSGGGDTAPDSQEVTQAAAYTGQSSHLETTYQYLPSYYFNSDGSVDEAGIRERINSEYDRNIQTLKLTFQQDYDTQLQTLQSMKDLRFAVVNRATGEIMTNFPQAGQMQAAELPALVAEHPWYMIYSVAENRMQLSSQSKAPQALYYLELAEQYDYYLCMDVPSQSDDVYGLLFSIWGGVSIWNDFVFFAVFFFLSAALTVFLIGKAGRREPEGEVRLLWSDRLYNDLHLLLSGGLMAGAASVFSLCIIGMTQMYQPYESAASFFRLCQIGLFASSFVFGAILLEWALSATRHIKEKSFLRRTLVWRILRFLLRPFRAFKRAVKGLPLHYEMKSIRKRVIAYAAGYFAVTGILLLFAWVFSSPMDMNFAVVVLVFLALAFTAWTIMFVWRLIAGLDQIMTAVANARAGDLDYPLDVSKMPRALKKFAEDVREMQQGMKHAVEEAVKGERMKTELITNVSHDLKTPLTSVINYVDLLKRCDLPDETAQGYLNVLADKSERLKHLIEDLTEASKASTGNITMNLMRVDLYELAMQAVGEYTDALTGENIEIRLNTPDVHPVVLADSQRLWRVIDNLIGNVRKYSMPGTRAYLVVSQENGYGVFSVKNISRIALDVPPEQLTQRFVRGDAARSTEGSGLGLSIAQSFCELMKGRFELQIDGDLFKATVRIPLAPPGAAEDSLPGAQKT